MLVLVEHLPHFVPSLTRCDIQLECCHCRDRGTNENSPNFHSSNFIQALIFFRPSSFQSCLVWRVRLVNIYILITVIKSHEKLRLNSPFPTQSNSEAYRSVFIKDFFDCNSDLQHRDMVYQDLTTHAVFDKVINSLLGLVFIWDWCKCVKTEYLLPYSELYGIAATCQYNEYQPVCLSCVPTGTKCKHGFHRRWSKPKNDTLQCITNLFTRYSLSVLQQCFKELFLLP